MRNKHGHLQPGGKRNSPNNALPSHLLQQHELASAGRSLIRGVQMKISASETEPSQKNNQRQTVIGDYPS